ncbi:hypothetical protein ACHI3A_12615, partial [Listeria monocytogenes]
QTGDDRDCDCHPYTSFAIQFSLLLCRWPEFWHMRIFHQQPSAYLPIQLKPIFKGKNFPLVSQQYKIYNLIL